MRRVLLLGFVTSVIVSATAHAQYVPPATAGAQSPTSFTTRLPPAPFLGSVPTGTATAEPITLTVLDVINRALDRNLGVLLADEGKDRAAGARWRALGAMLPDVSGRLAFTRQVVDLAAYGFPLPEGIPAVVGPFNLFDARVFGSLPLYDLKALNDLRAERHNVAAVAHNYQSARELVVLVAANAYLQALAASARAESARAQNETALALFNQATDLRQNGLVAGIEVLRAQVELDQERQRVTMTQNDYEKAKLQLGRIIGLPAGQTITLVSELPNVPIPDLTLESALEMAYRQRPDYLAALERVKAAEAIRAAAVGDMTPSVHLNADYGELVASTSSHPTFTIVGAVNVPIFQGGKRGKLMEADADLRSRRSEADDLKAAIYYDVKTTFMDLQANGEQLQVATRARDVAQTALTQSRDRFAAGVTNNLEVVQAQEAVSRANEQYINALYLYNVDKALLARNLGDAEQAVRRYLGGPRQ
ncbi:MAG TPA: TolC family protein [Vicinamibacterales bacterium]|nr:TolC family protein [Vicinamibacterales bacterium]